jgi:hypothetical protein
VLDCHAKKKIKVKNICDENFKITDV